MKTWSLIVVHWRQWISERFWIEMVPEKSRRICTSWVLSSIFPLCFATTLLHFSSYWGYTFRFSCGCDHVSCLCSILSKLMQSSKPSSFWMLIQFIYFKLKALQTADLSHLSNICIIYIYIYCIYIYIYTALSDNTWCIPKLAVALVLSAMEWRLHVKMLSIS